MIANCPYMKDDAHEWCKEIAVTMVEKELEKLKMGMKEVVMEPLILLWLNFKNHLLLS